MEFTPVERAVLEWCANHAACAELAAQFRAATPTKRKYTGVGSYTDLSIPTGLPLVPLHAIPRGSHGPIYGPDIAAVELESGACSQVYCEGGALSFLEIAAYSNSFPEHLSGVVLTPPAE